MSIPILTARDHFTKEQLIEHAQGRKELAEAFVSDATRPLNAHKDLILAEIALAALAAAPVGYINRHTGVFHQPEWMIGNELDRHLYFPVFGAHALVGGL